MKTKAAANRLHRLMPDAGTDVLAPVEPAPAVKRLPRLLDVADVAEVLGVRETFVYALARRGELPAVRLGDRYVRFRPEALGAWIEQRESTRPKGTR